MIGGVNPSHVFGNLDVSYPVAQAHVTFALYPLQSFFGG